MVLVSLHCAGAAQANGRKWIGIDQSEHAIEATKEKLETVEGGLFIAKPEYEYKELKENTVANKVYG